MAYHVLSYYGLKSMLMKHLITALFCSLIIVSAKAQVMTKFTWDNAALGATKALIGANATSISSSAVISADGDGGTNGLNPGLPKQDIDLVIPGSDYMVNALDVSVAFMRKEAQASFFTIGNFDFGLNAGSLYFTLPLDTTSAAGFKIISKSGLYAVPSDNNFHIYRLLYNNSTGTATVYVDGTLVYTYNGTSNTNMYWTGATNAIVGNIMDGGGSNVSVLDNVIIQNASQIILPLQILSFEAQATGSSANLTWSTSSMANDKRFAIERSSDGWSYETISTDANQSLSGTNNYQFIDRNPINGNNYYRLSIIDNDGNQNYSSVQYLSFSNTTRLSVHCFPNPTIDYINVTNGGQAGIYAYSLFTIDGKRVQEGNINLADGGNEQLNVKTAPKGILLLELQNEQDHSTTTIKIVKQ